MKKESFPSHSKKMIFVVALLTVLASSQMAKAETVKLMDNSDRCVYDAKIDMDRCFSEYEICDGVKKPTISDISFDFKSEKDFSVSMDTTTKQLINLKSDCISIRIDATKNKFINVDNIPIFNGVAYTKYAWWNSSFDSRIPIHGYCPECISDTTMPLLASNSTANVGAYIDGSMELFWGNFTVNSSWSLIGYLYFNDETDYVLSDPTQTYQLEMDMDEGNSTDYGNPYDINTTLVYHFANVSATRIHDELDTYDATIGGDAVKTTGQIGHGLRCDGVGDNFNFAPASINGLAEGSISLWINATGNNAYPMRAWKDTDEHMVVSIEANKWRMDWDNTGPYVVDFQTALTPGEWQHVVMTWNSTNVYLYLNGTFANKDDGGFVMPIMNEFFVCSYDGGGYIEMELDEFRIYDRVLSDAEINTIYLNTVGLYNLTQFGLVNTTPIFPVPPDISEPELIIFWDIEPKGFLSAILDILTGNDGLVKGVIAYIGSLTVSGDVTVAGDMDVSGNSTINIHYGEMWYHNHTATPLNFAVANRYYNLTFDSSVVNGFIFNDTGDYLEAGYPGTYKASYMASGDGQNNHIYYTDITINGVVIDKCESHKKMSAGGDIVTMIGNCFIKLSVGDKVRLATADIGGTGAGHYYSSDLDLVRIGD